MKLTTKILRERFACEEGVIALAERFPDGCSVENAVDACIAVKRSEWAAWLLTTFPSRWTGVTENYRSDGSLAYRENWAEGKRHGVAESFWFDGSVAGLTNRVKGELHGVMTCFRSDGSVAWRENWEKGKVVD